MTEKTGAKPQIVKGVTFHCYRTGILRYEWRSEDGLLAAGRHPRHNTYWARIKDAYLPTRFRSLKNAMKAAVSN